MKKCHHDAVATSGETNTSDSTTRAIGRALCAAVGVVTVLTCDLGLAQSPAGDGHPATPAFDLSRAQKTQVESLAREAAAALAPSGARIVAEAGALDRRLRLAPCTQVEAHLVSGMPAWGATRIGLRCTSGPVAWRTTLPVQVQVLAPAWTSKAALPAGAVIADTQWTVAEADWAASPAAPFGAAQPIAGRVLARPVAAGQALRDGDLQARRWFSSGQNVRIVMSGEGFAVTADGQALGHGIEGQAVRVRTESGRVLSGLAVGDALVEVRL